MPNPEMSMPTKRKNPEACGFQRTKMHNSRHEVGKGQKQPAFGKDDPTINLNGFCRATLLRRREKPFEHGANLLRHFERSRE
jgi:hypothetical protein